MLYKTVESLLQYESLIELIVINDGGEFPLDLPIKAKMINLQTNNGEAHAINVAWQLCKTDYFVVISDDDPQPNNWLRPLLKAAEANPRYVVYYPSTFEVVENKTQLVQFAHVYDRTKFHTYMRSPCLAGALINARILKAQKVENLRIDGLIYPNDLIQWLNLSMRGDFLAVPEARAFWWVHKYQTSNVLSDLVRAELFFDNISCWLLENLEEQSLSVAMIVCFFRSVQLLKSKKNRMPWIARHAITTLKFLRLRKFSIVKIFISFGRAMTGLVILKVSNV